MQIVKTGKLNIFLRVFPVGRKMRPVGKSTNLPTYIETILQPILKQKNGIATGRYTRTATGIMEKVFAGMEKMG